MLPSRCSLISPPLVERISIDCEAGGDGVDPNRKDNWDNCCRLLYRWDRASDGDNDVDPKADEFGCDLGVALGTTLRPAIFDRDGTVLDPTEFAQVRHKSSRPWTKGRSICAQEPDRLPANADVVRLWKVREPLE
jgi:hypothetical protein